MRIPEWVEEHWAAVGMVASTTAALTLSVILAVAFNATATRRDHLQSDATAAAPPVSQAGTRAGASSIAGPI